MSVLIWKKNGSRPNSINMTFPQLLYYGVHHRVYLINVHLTQICVMAWKRSEARKPHPHEFWHSTQMLVFHSSCNFLELVSCMATICSYVNHMNGIRGSSLAKRSHVTWKNLEACTLMKWHPMQRPLLKTWLPGNTQFEYITQTTVITRLVF